MNKNWSEMNKEMPALIAKKATFKDGMEALLELRRKVPFYCSAWSNIRSARNAIRSGLFPTWVEMTVKPARLVDEMNQTEAEKTTLEQQG